jgi:SAM-dependent methyltransferase
MVQVSSALTLAKTRIRAQAKFGDMAHQFFFTPDALEQASDPRIRAYRATRFAHQHVTDFCCGVGADSVALAHHADFVIGIDNDPLRVAMARLNSEKLGIQNIEFVLDDVTIRDLASNGAFFYDPARRDESGGRLFGVEQYLPPLSTIRRWDGHLGAVKLAPGVDLDELRGYDGGVEFISMMGELKEAVLWLDGASSPKATRISDDKIVHWEHTTAVSDEKPLSHPRQWLIEPDPALIRAGLVQDVAEKWGVFMLDETIAYLTGDHHPQNDWARAWKIWDWMPFNIKRLRAYLRERHIGRITVKKRGSPMTPEDLINQVKPKGDGACTVVLTRHLGNPIMIICAEYPDFVV